MSYEGDMGWATWAYEQGNPAEGRRLVLMAILKHPVRFWKDLGSRPTGGPIDQVLDAFDGGGTL